MTDDKSDVLWTGWTFPDWFETDWFIVTRADVGDEFTPHTCRNENMVRVEILPAGTTAKLKKRIDGDELLKWLRGQLVSTECYVCDEDKPIKKTIRYVKKMQKGADDDKTKG